MNAWLIAVAVLLVGGLAPCLVVTSFGSVPRRLVGLTVANTLTVVILLLLAEGLHRTSYVDLALVLVLLGPVGTLVFTRILGPDERADDGAVNAEGR
ncbi:monovalent cation/H+ antiporter complex subunit F [Embleya sp. MST-111070]|uniref:monovalent cation/H+ antiporter complex subunit F n=1 Tax=Embleya sp. MST-111070 TaxID=3398231 RepID=UPI003F736010